MSYKLTTTLCYLSAILGFAVLYTIAVNNDSVSVQFIYQINWQLLLKPEVCKFMALIKFSQKNLTTYICLLDSILRNF